MYNSALVVDDDPVYARLVARCLKLVGAVQVQTASSVAAAIGLMDTCLAPELVVTEVVVAREACYPLLRHCAAKQVRPALVAMTGKASRSQVFRLCSYGVSSFLEKPFLPDALREAILPSHTELCELTVRTLGVSLASSTLMPDRVVERYRNVYRLSNAETDVLRYWWMGLAARAIADEKGVSLNTVKTQIRSILRKTGAPSMKQLSSQMRREVARLHGEPLTGTTSTSAYSRNEARSSSRGDAPQSLRPRVLA